MSNLFNMEDIERLEKTITVREKLLDKLVEEGLSTSSKDVEALTGLADSMDKSVFTKAKLSLQETQQKTDEETKEILRGLLMQFHEGKAAPESSSNTRELPEYTPSNLEVLEGEVIKGKDSISADEFI